MKPLVNPPLIREHPLAREMQLGYAFNEGAGRRLNDVTGRYPATLTNFTFTSASGWSGSPSGGGVRFDGSNDYAQVLTRQILNGRRKAAVAARVKVLGGLGVTQVIYGENISAGIVFGIFIHPTAGQFSTYVFNGSDVNCLSTTVAVVGREYDIVGEWDVSQPALRIYVNGVLENTLTSWSGTFSSGINNVRIGGSTNVGGLPFNGIISHVYGYSTLLGTTGAEALRADPYQMFDRLPATGIWVPSVYTQNLTLTAETGVFTVSGQDANLTPALLLDAETGQFTVTGQDADLIVDQGAEDTHDGFWRKKYREMWERKPKLPEIEEIIEAVQESPKAAIEVVAKEVRQEYPEINYQQVVDNIQLQRFIAEQILIVLRLKRIQDDEDDIEAMLLL